VVRSSSSSRSRTAAHTGAITYTPTQLLGYSEFVSFVHLCTQAIGRDFYKPDQARYSCSSKQSPARLVDPCADPLAVRSVSSESD
jgi:hypothetical protein